MVRIQPSLASSKPRGNQRLSSGVFSCPRNGYGQHPYMSVGVGHSTHQEVLASACHYDRALSLEHLFSPITLELVN